MKRGPGDDIGVGGLDSDFSGPDGKRARTEDGHFVGRRGRGRGGSRSKGSRLDSKLPTMVYREGEPLKDLAQYLEGPEGGPQQVEVRIAPEQMTAHNKQVKARQLWGCDVYTEDSDLVAVIMHMGFFSTNAGQPPYTVQEFRATVTPMPPQEKYESKSRNGLFSRAWTTPSKDCAYTVDSVKILTKIGTLVSLEPRLEGAPMLAPTFIPAHADRTMTTRAAAASVERRLRLKQEVTVQYSLCNEPWIKYTMGVIADRGLKPSQWTSSRLIEEVLYLETHRERFELCRIAPAEGDPRGDQYRFSKCKRILPLSGIRKLGLPLPEAELVVQHQKLFWEDFEWTTTGLVIGDTSYPIMRVLFAPIDPERYERQTDADNAEDVEEEHAYAMTGRPAPPMA